MVPSGSGAGRRMTGHERTKGAACIDALTIYGTLAVGAMLLAYALESRSRGFVLMFAAACAASSLYGFLAGVWSFGVVEMA